MDLTRFPCLTAWPEQCPCADDPALGEGCPWSQPVVLHDSDFECNECGGPSPETSMQGCVFCGGQGDIVLRGQARIRTWQPTELNRSMNVQRDHPMVDLVERDSASAVLATATRRGRHVDRRECPATSVTPPDPLVQLLHDHMRVAVEDDHTIKCWCGERFEGGIAHFTHVAAILRDYMAMEIDSD